jgi:hypothetical protein
VGIESGSLMLVDERNVVDSLWGDAEARRQVRVRYSISRYRIIVNWITQLGKWVHAHEVPSLEDILSDPASIPLL